jgi:Recombinase zinc beta ribbon domain
VQQRPRDRREWLQVDVPEWRIVSEELWHAAHARLNRARQNYLAGTQGAAWGRPVTGTAAKYLLTGIARCGVCAAGLTVRSRAHGRRRSLRYVCATHHYRGRAICANGLELHQSIADDAVLELLEADVLRATVVDQAISIALDTLCRDRGGDRRTALTQQLAETERKLRQLTAAVEAGGHLPALIAAITEREEQRAVLRVELEALGAMPTRRDRKALERALRARLADWRSLLRAQVAEARQVLETLLEERLVFTPQRDKSGEQCYQLRARFAFGRMFSEILRSQGGTSPTGFANMWKRKLGGIMMRPPRWSRPSRLLKK